MTELLSSEDVRSDPELIALVRGGDRDAYGQLYQRHVDAANRLARQLARGSDADDLVSEAFTKVMLLLQAGQGPDVAFRAYLLTAVRRLHVDRVRGEARLTTSDDMTAFDPGIPFQDTAVNQFESGAAARAFASLPERWQLVLWHLEVEGQKPADIAPLLGMSPNSVSALAYRAREGLRQAFLSAHLRETDEATCRWVTENLGSYVRKGLSRRDSTKIDAHLRECRSCTAMYLELAEVNSNLAGVIAPLLLGGLAAGYLAGVPGGSAGGALILWDKVKDFAGANGGATTVGAAAATVAAVAIAATLLGPADEVSDKEPIADSPATAASSGRTAAPPAQRRPGARDSADTRKAAVPAPRSAGVPQQQTAAPAEDLPTTEPLLEAAVDEVVDVVDPEPPAGGPDGSTLAIAGASLDDEALSLTLSGVSSQARDVVVRMTSRSGQVWFASQGSPCEIDPRDTAHCRLGTLARVGTVGNSAWSRAVPGLVESSTESLRLPIEYPATLEEDEVTVSIRLPGAAQDEVVDSLTLTFRPSRPGGGPTDPTTGRHRPHGPHHRRHRPDRPHHRRHRPDRPHHRRHRPDRPHHRRHRPDRPHHRRHRPDRPHHRRHRPDRPHHRRHRPDRPHHRRHRPDRPHHRRHRPDRPHGRGQRHRAVPVAAQRHGPGAGHRRRPAGGPRASDPGDRGGLRRRRGPAGPARPAL